MIFRTAPAERNDKRVVVKFALLPKVLGEVSSVTGDMIKRYGGTVWLGWYESHQSWFDAYWDGEYRWREVARLRREKSK